MSHKLKIAGWISVGALAGALTTVSLQTVARGSMAPLPLEELQQLAAVFGMVKSDYVEPVDEKKLITDAISGMVASLDPHSQYFDKKSFKEFREGTSGRFVGVGIEISQEDGLVKVVSPIEGSPAYRAGLKPNDLITKIDDTVVKGLTLNEAVKRMRGEPNTKVTLTIFRKDESRSFPVTITREEIRTQSVRWQGDGALATAGSGCRVPGAHGGRFRAQGRRDLQGRAQPQGPGAGSAQRPGGLSTRPVAISAAFRRRTSPSFHNGQLAESNTCTRSPSSTSAAPAQIRCAVAAALRACRGRLVNEAPRPPVKSSPRTADHKRANRMGARRSAGSVQSTPARPDTGLKLTTAPTHADGQVDPGQGHRARRHGDESEEQCLLRAADPRSRPRQAPWQRPGPEVKDPSREKMRDEARKKAEEEAR